MGQQPSRAVFDSLLAKTHVQHALLQPDGRHNNIPAALATLLFLDGTASQLEAAYDSMNDDTGPWEASPRSITDEETKSRLLGDFRFQRAFMTYFSMENGRFGGNSKALAIFQLFQGEQPLIHGLFSGVGRPLACLSDAIELRAAILVVESLTLSAVDWMDPMCELLTHPDLALPSTEFLSPEDIIGRVAHDGRFSGVMKGGPSFQGVPFVFASPAAKVALLEYVRLLDCRDLSVLLQQLSALSVLMLCATHKPGQPVFDFYLGHLPTCANSVQVILDCLLEEYSHKILLVRGVWLLMMLTYITQLRPVINGKLLVKDLPDGETGWETIYEEFRGQAVLEGKYRDLEFLRVLRSLWELSKRYSEVHGRLYFHAAWKLVSEWKGWVGLGVDREVMLNIRL